MQPATPAGALDSGQSVPRNTQDTKDCDVTVSARCGSRPESCWVIH